MNTYVPPHLRYKEKNKKKIDAKKVTKTQEIKITEQEFPELISTTKKNNINENLEKSFAEITEEKKEKKEENNSLDKIKSGWSIIKKDINSKIVIIDSKETIKTKERLTLNKKQIENQELFENLSKMIKNWNYFRDTENELRGDLSPYYYYKEELEKMREEDILFEKKIDEFNNEINNDSDSDDESNRNLIY